MRVVIAPDKFKGAISARQAAEAIARGVSRAHQETQITICPMADGGEGTVAAMVEATAGRIITKKVCGPLPTMVIEGEIGISGDGRTAVIEMASASGLALTPADCRNPLRTTTYGTGELIQAAAGMGVRRIILGIGGSATTDAGLGALQALGARVQMADGSVRSAKDQPIVGGEMGQISAVQWQGALPELLIACDVTNPLYGPEGAAAVFGPQKGASPEEVTMLDQWQRRLADITGTDLVAKRPGSGAAGGLGYGLCAFLPGTRMAGGFDLVAEALGFEAKLRGADWCITAEGRLDRSSLKGKTAVGVARLCRRLDVPCTVLAGSVEAEAQERLYIETGAVAMSIVDGPMSLEEAMRCTDKLLERTATWAARVWK